MYGRFLADLKTINPALKIIGLTATPFRLDSGRLDQGEGAMFDGIAHDTNVRDLIDDGYLCPPVSFRQRGAEINTAGIGTRGGEFIAAQLEANAIDPEVVNAIADRIVAAGQDRRGWLIFGCTVKHCEALAEALRARGYAGRGVYGDTDQNEGKGTRDRAIADFKAQRLRFLVSQGVLTTGFNARHVDLIALARPTKSTGLYIQMVGRGTRLSPETNKADCLILDFGGNIGRHGPFDDPFIPEKKEKGTGAAPFKECPECECCCGTMTRICPSCGYEFPPPERVVDTRPAEKPILSVEPEWLEVSEASYRLHEKLGSPSSLRVEYRVGLTWHREWVCLEHSGYPRTKAESWWLRRAPAPVPRNIVEAIARAGEIAVPSHIRVKRNGKFDEVIAYRFEPREAIGEAA
jgi:DNA repair protein RadD